jgi:hypothetical protein
MSNYLPPTTAAPRSRGLDGEDDDAQSNDKLAVNQLAERTETHADKGFVACWPTQRSNLATAWQQRCAFGASIDTRTGAEPCARVPLLR